MKRLTALFLAVLMLIAALSSAAFAENMGFEELFNAYTAAEDKLEYLTVLRRSDEAVFASFLVFLADAGADIPEGILLTESAMEESTAAEPAYENLLSEESLYEEPVNFDPGSVEPVFVEPVPLPEQTAHADEALSGEHSEPFVAVLPDETMTGEPVFLSDTMGSSVKAEETPLLTENTENEKDNFGGAALNLTEDEIKDKLLTEDDLSLLAAGTPISVWLSVRESAEPSGEAKDLIDQKIQEEIPGEYDSLWLDISVMKQVDTAPAEASQPNTGKSIELQFDLSQNDFIKQNREYKVVHYHEADKTVEFIDSVTEEDGVIAFSTGKFSNFGLLGVGPWEVSFNMNGHGSQIASQMLSDGDTIEKPADPAAEGYVFEGWYKDAACSTPWDFAAPVTEDTVLFAKWSVLRVEVSFHMNSHGTQVPSQTLDYGKKATRPADPTADGYRFKGWYTKNDYKTSYDFSKPVKADTVLYAKWVRISKVTAYVNDIDRGRISGESVRILEEGEEFTFNARIISQGFYFGRVKVDGVIVSGLQGAGTGAASYRFTNSDASKDHTVEFVIFDSMGAPATRDAAAPGVWALLGMCSLASALFLGSRVSRKKTRS